jgi:hypothetical protein
MPTYPTNSQPSNRKPSQPRPDLVRIIRSVADNTPDGASRSFLLMTGLDLLKRRQRQAVSR